MKITKFVHSCLLVETPNRTAIFDPGTMSSGLLANHHFEYLDDIFITHKHADHMDIDYIKTLVSQFPNVRVTAPADAVEELKTAGIAQASSQLPEGVTSLEAPHESVEPMFATVDELGYNYLQQLSHPGDSHSFSETCPILALPLQAPWGSTVNAVRLALKLKPQYIVPIHDWHWNEIVRQSQYDSLEQFFAKQNITFIKPVDGEPFIVNPA